MPDEVSINRLKLLHPAIRQDAIDAYNEAVRKTPVGVHPVIIETFRSFEMSDLYYQKGRTKPGPIVSYARGGQSYHNYGLALDFALQVNGKIPWKINKDWMTVVDIFKSHGFEAGIDWAGKKKDAPHFQKTFGLNWRELLKRHNEGGVDADGYVDLS
jgi:peptidoglycan L-alanyl-D-glutamate endopeptidase CwlK